jgi:LysR family transcriptional regulator, cys regulon transcriptional activator
MKLQQLRCLTEVVRRGLNVSEAAEALHTSQPGVSKQIRALEDELGVEVFARHGKRLVAVTEPGKAVIAIAERILAEAHNLRRAGEEYANDKLGTLTIAATHTQARYALPKAVAAFKRRYPNVELLIHQGNPTQICDQVIAGEADLGVATEMIGERPELVSLPVYQWNRCVVVPPKHPLLKAGRVTLEKIAEYPIVTYDFAFANRSLVQKAFESRGLTPHVVLSSRPTSSWGSAWASSPAWPSTRRATGTCARSTPVTCSNRAPRAWASSAAPTCGATPTSSSSCSPRTCRARSSSPRCAARKAPATSFSRKMGSDQNFRRRPRIEPAG